MCMKRIVRKLATAILAGALAFSMVPATVQAAGWKQNKNGYWWQENDYSYPKNQWKTIYGKQYHFNSGGYMDTDWTKVDGKWYYLGGKNDGAKKTYWYKVRGKYYWLGSNGVMRTGWQKVYNKKYYYLGGANDGAMKTGWQKIGRYWYWLGNDGDMKSGWQTIYKKKYYLGGPNDGAMKTGWQQIGEYWYYFGKSGESNEGVLRTNTWVGNYYVDGNGRWDTSKTKKTDKQVLNEFISGGEYKSYTYGYSNLKYVITDINADTVPELLIQSNEKGYFHTTWVFALNKNKRIIPVTLDDNDSERVYINTYGINGYGSFAYSKKYNAVKVSPTFRPNNKLSVDSFYKLQGTSLKYSFGVGHDEWDNSSTFKYDSNGNKTAITESERNAYTNEFTDFSWTLLSGSTSSYSETDESQSVVQSIEENEALNEAPAVISEEPQSVEENTEEQETEPEVQEAETPEENVDEIETPENEDTDVDSEEIIEETEEVEE